MKPWKTGFGSVDGQNFGTADPTVKARYSRKYLGKDRGDVAFALLDNHVALQTELLGANQHESQLTIHADCGSSMTSRSAAFLLSNLDITKSHSRPHVSNDNLNQKASSKR